MANTCIVISLASDKQQDNLVEKIKGAIGEQSLYFKDKRRGYKVNYDALSKVKEIVDSVTADFTFEDEKINNQSIDVLHSILLRVCDIDPKANSEIATFILDHITNGIVNMGINKMFSVRYSHNPNRTSRLNANRNVIFTKDTDYAKFKNEYKRYLIRKIFISSNGSAIKSNKDFSDNLLLFRNQLINDLKEKVLEKLNKELNKDNIDKIFIQYRIDKLNNLDFLSINSKNIYNSNLALNILFDECEKMFSADMEGNLFNGSSRKVNDYKKFIMARDFDTFVNDFTDGTIRTRLGMFNSLLGHPDGKYVVNIGTDMKFTYSDDTQNFKDYSSKILPLYLSTIEINDSNGQYITFLDLQHIISYIHNKYPKFLYQLRNNPDSLKSIFKEVVDLMYADPDVRKPVKAAAKSLYNNLFNSQQVYSLYNIFKRENNIKYNLYNMLLNYINTATTAKYLQTIIDETGNTEVNQIESAVTSRYAKGIKANFMIQSSMRSFDKLASQLGIEPMFNKDGKLSGFSFKLNNEEYQAVFSSNQDQKDSIIFVKTQNLVSNQDKYTKFLIENRQQFGSMFSEATGVVFDSSYFDFIANSQSGDAGQLFDLMMASILNTYVSDKIIGEIDENASPEKMLEAINNQLAFKLTSGNIDFNLKCLDFKDSFYIEGAITSISKANAALNNRLHQSFIVDAEGKKLPNMTLTSAANDDSIILEKLRKKVQLENDWLAQNPGRTPLYSIPFYYNLFYPSEILGGTYIDQNVVNVDGDIKSVSKMTSAELSIHDFINRFLLNDTHMYIQPMVYSDKSRIWVKRIELNKAINLQHSDKYKAQTLNDLNIDGIHELHQLTMSKQYDIYTQNFFNSLDLVAKDLGINIVYDPNDTIQDKYTKLKARLNGMPYLDFIKAVDNIRKNGIDINVFPEAQYHVKNGLIQFDNALFDYFNYLYKNPKAYNQKVNIEKKLYIQALLKDGIKLYTYDSNGNINSAVSKLYRELRDSNETSWINEDTREVVLYKINNGSNQMSDEDVYDDSITVEFNPYLEKYFALNMLLSDNYNAMLYGFPYAHKGSGKVKSFDPAMLSSPEKMRVLKEDESARTVQENKRGVIGGATITPFKRNSLNGIPSTYRIAVIQDISMPIFNLQAVNDSGKNTSTRCKPMDGAIFCNPFTSILEINSLPEINIGSVHKKPICHFDRTNVGISGLLKCATFALNNAYIRDSVRGTQSYIDNRRLLQKMSGKQFTEEQKAQFDFSIPRLYNYYYKDKNDFQDYKIIEITKNPDNTYTRIKVNNNGQVIEDTIEINSIYDVWEMLGGELSKTKINNNLVFSEGSIEETVKLINSNIFVKAEFKDNEATLAKTQEFYDQPLKYMMVDYLVNESAVKNGASNLNTVDFYYKDLNTATTNETIDNLVTTDIDTLFLGVQLSAEHDLSDTDISEMTQVISALEQKGLRHNSVMAIYNNIGRNIAKQLKPYVQDIDNEKKYSDLYNILGRKLVQIFSTGNQGLTQAYIQAIQKDVEENKNLSDQIRRIPFNDPNISSALQTGFTSGINKQIIRRTYNGLAAVQAPSYDMIVIFEGPDGKTYKYSDLINSCNSQEELDAKLSSMDRIVSDPSEVFVEDYVQILDGNTVVNEGKVSGYENDNNLGLKDILNLRGTNYQIKILGSKGRNLRHQNYQFEVNLPNRVQKLCLYDLDSSILAFKLKSILDNSGAQDYASLLSILEKAKSNDYYRVKELEEQMRKYSDTSFILAINNYLTSKADADYDNVHSFIVQALQNDINTISTNKKITIPVDFRTDKKKTKKSIDIFNIKQTSNEIMIGRLQAQKFGIEPGDSINDILQDGYFESKVRRLNHNPVDRMIKYDVQFNRLNGKHLYVITDRNIFEQMLADNDLSLYRAQISYENGQMVKVENDSIEYPIHRDYQFATYAIPGTNETMEFVYVPSKHMNKFIKDVESTHNYSSLRINPRIENEKVIMDAITTSRTINRDIKKLFISDSTYEESLEQFADLHEEYYWNEQNNNANKLRRSFEQFLNFIGTRIPSQSMQSFMNMKVVGFVDMDTNIIWHNPALIVWTGSDFDIDKIYMLGCSISDNGVYDSWSDLFDFNSKELFILSNQLDIPIELTGESVNLKNVQKAIGEDDLAGAAYEYLYPTPETTNSVFGGNVNAHKAFYFGKIVKAINYLTRNNLRLNVGQEEDNEYSQALQQLIDIHFGTKLSGRRELEAIKNKIYFDMIYNGDNVVNWVMQTTPISMSDAQNAASNSVEGAYSKQLSNFNPYARFIAQFQNSIGKDGIGIFATGIKIWSMISTYFNDLYLHDNTTQIGGYNVENNGQFLGYNKDGKQLLLSQFKVVPNLNFDMFMANSNEERKVLLKEQYDRGYIPSDVYASLSTLLSAATDNAKELILEKINASPELAGIYAYMLVTGISFKDATEFMIHPIISKVVNKSRKNIFDSSTKFRNISNAIDYYLNGVNIKNYLTSKEHAEGLQASFKEVTGKSLSDILFPTNQKQLLEYQEDIRKFLDSDLFGNKSWVNKKLPKKGADYDEMQYEEDGMYDAFVEAEYEYYDDDFQSFDKTIVDSNVMAKRYFQEVLSRLNDVYNIDTDQIKTNLDTLRKLQNAAQELTIIGRGGSLNQGIKTQFAEKISFEIQIENFINKKIKDNQQRIPQELQEYKSFNLVRYCNDEDYKQKMIQVYEYVKDTFNILAIWDNVPHFKQMFKTYGAVDNVLNEFIPFLYGKKKEICKDFIDKKFIKAKDTRATKKIDRYLQDLISYKFLTQFDSKITIPKGNKIYQDNKIVTTPIDKELDFSNPNDIATFKLYMENVVFNKLKEQYDNMFVNSLQLDKALDDYGIQYTFMKVPLNSDYNDNDANERLYNELLYAFNKIALSKIPGLDMNIQDAFALYNIITNSNRTNSNTFSKMLVESIKDPDSILVQYSNFVADQNNYIDIAPNYDEILFRIIPYNETVNNLQKTYDRVKKNPIFQKDGRTQMFVSLNNAIKLPYIANTIYDIDNLLDANILGQILRLASLNKFELKLKCDD